MLPWTHSPGSCPGFISVDFCFLSTVALGASKYPFMSNSMERCTCAEKQAHIWALLTSLVSARKRAEQVPETWALGTGIKHCRWCFINWLWRGAQDERYLRELGKSYLGKDRVLVMALFLWGRHFGTLVSSIGPLCAIIPRASLRRNSVCARGTVNVAAFDDGHMCPWAWHLQSCTTGLLSSDRPTWWGIKALGTHAWGWQSILCTHDLKFWVPFFICITAAQDWSLISSASGKPRQYLPQFYLQSK